MIEVVNKRILVDGRPRIMMAGEIHYFRVAREAWPDRISKLEGGRLQHRRLLHPLAPARARATGQFDLDGRTDAEAGPGRLHRPLPRARPLVSGAARPVHHGRDEKRGTALPAVCRASGDRPGHVGREAGPDAHASTTSRRHSWPKAARWYEAVMPVLAAAAAAERRQRHRGAARQRDRDALLGHELARSDRAAASRTLGDWLRRQYAGRDLTDRYPLDLGTIAGSTGGGGALAREDYAPALHARSWPLHARSIRPVCCRAAGLRRGVRRRRRAVCGQHPRHRARSAGRDLPDRDQPAVRVVHAGAGLPQPAATTIWAT